MKQIENQAAQGDVLFVRVKEIPSTAKLKENFDGIVAHSETGHHHKFSKIEGLQFFETEDSLTCYLRIDAPVALEHHRSFDQHETVQFPAGKYMIRRQREHAPEGWRRVED